ncbi:hypothetical protein FQN60_010389, partial [Etheostoma spectabile]
TNSTFLHLTIPWVLISGAIIQVYVSRLQVTGGGRFGSVISSIYVAVGATGTGFGFRSFFPLSQRKLTVLQPGPCFLGLKCFSLLFGKAPNNLVLLFLTASGRLFGSFPFSTAQLPYPKKCGPIKTPLFASF